VGGALLVAFLEYEGIGSREPVREPHRHDYHELIWVRSGSGVHLLDGEPYELQAGTVALIGRGQVHTVQRSAALSAAVVRFGDEALEGSAGWLLAGRGGRTVAVPPGEVHHLEATIDALAFEARRPADERTVRLERHLLAALLLWVERWYGARPESEGHAASQYRSRPEGERDAASQDDAARIESLSADDAAVELHRRFARVLERDFSRHHDAVHYADALAVPPAALSRALAEVTGRTTKELITDRVMLEAARLLRYTDRSVGEVAHAAGFTDPLYFSRAFKRRFGTAPKAYRDRVRGRG
jgi:AraC family transcriptional activator of pobA